MANSTSAARTTWCRRAAPWALNVILFSSGSALHAEIRTISYNTESCACTAHYDTQKIPVEQANDIVNLISFDPMSPGEHGYAAPLLFCEGPGLLAYGGDKLKPAKLQKRLEADRPS